MIILYHYWTLSKLCVSPPPPPPPLQKKMIYPLIHGKYCHIHQFAGSFISLSTFCQLLCSLLPSAVSHTSPSLSSPVPPSPPSSPLHCCRSRGDLIQQLLVRNGKDVRHFSRSPSHRSTWWQRTYHCCLHG